MVVASLSFVFCDDDLSSFITVSLTVDAGLLIVDGDGDENAEFIVLHLKNNNLFFLHANENRTHRWRMRTTPLIHRLLIVPLLSRYDIRTPSKKMRTLNMLNTVLSYYAHNFSTLLSTVPVMTPSPKKKTTLASKQKAHASTPPPAGISSKDDSSKTIHATEIVQPKSPGLAFNINLRPISPQRKIGTTHPGGRKRREFKHSIHVKALKPIPHLEYWLVVCYGWYPSRFDSNLDPTPPPSVNQPPTIAPFINYCDNIMNLDDAANTKEHLDVCGVFFRKDPITGDQMLAVHPKDRPTSFEFRQVILSCAPNAEAYSALKRKIIHFATTTGRATEDDNTRLKDGQSFEIQEDPTLSTDQNFQTLSDVLFTDDLYSLYTSYIFQETAFSPENLSATISAIRLPGDTFETTADLFNLENPMNNDQMDLWEAALRDYCDRQLHNIE